MKNKKNIPPPPKPPENRIIREGKQPKPPKSFNSK
jgi:hypothetical protein